MRPRLFARGDAPAFDVVDASLWAANKEGEVAFARPDLIAILVAPDIVAERHRDGCGFGLAGGQGDAGRGGGGLGDILFVDSTRINLGLIQPDVDVFWDLAPHDLSIMDFVLPGGLDTSSVSAHGSDPLRTGKACVGYLAMPLQGGAMAHVNVNWLSPTKIRQMVIGGTKRTLVWDDLNPQQRISVYDRGVDIDAVSKETTLDRRAANISYRLGDTWSPALEEREALGGVVAEFAAAIRESRPARTSGDAGMRVLSVLDAAQRSLAAGGAPAPMNLDIPPHTSRRTAAA